MSNKYLEKIAQRLTEDERLRNLPRKDVLGTLNPKLRDELMEQIDERANLEKAAANFPKIVSKMTGSRRRQMDSLTGKMEAKAKELKYRGILQYGRPGNPKSRKADRIRENITKLRDADIQAG